MPHSHVIISTGLSFLLLSVTPSLGQTSPKPAPQPKSEQSKRVTPQPPRKPVTQEQSGRGARAIPQASAQKPDSRDKRAPSLASPRALPQNTSSGVDRAILSDVGEAPAPAMGPVVPETLAAASASGRERLLTPDETRAMFSGKTWLWSVGGGYFDPDGSFKAAVGETATSMSATRGTWRAGDAGELCIDALWGEQTSVSEEVCFYHWDHEGNILQKKGSSGGWYTFRSSPAKADDEQIKLLTGDHVAAYKPNPV